MNIYKDKTIKIKRPEPGSAPGIPFFTGVEFSEDTKIKLTRYNADFADTEEITSIMQLLEYQNCEDVLWLDVIGLNNIETIKGLAGIFELHNLTVEDILDVFQRSKLDVYSNYSFVTLKVITDPNENYSKFNTLQLSTVLGKNFVITFQEKDCGLFKHLQKRILEDSGRIRQSNADFLLYSIVDTVVDRFFYAIDGISEGLEELEDTMLTNPSSEDARRIHHYRGRIPELRRAVRPIQHIVNELRHSTVPQVNENLNIFLRDVYDHVVQINDTIEMHRDMITGLLDLYLSSINNQMNKIMQYLSIIGTIFLPLTFITGIYGMNFEYMPELKWHWGYFAILTIMFLIIVMQLTVFKFKKWI